MIGASTAADPLRSAAVPRVHRTLILLLAVAAAVAIAPATASAKTVWLCKPGQKSNPCTPGLRTTVYSPAGKKLRVTQPRPDRPPRFDCFYVYPTVSDQKAPLASKRIDPEERSIALYQTARYSQYCRVYAPMYRQVTLQSLLGGGRPNTHPSVPYDDVREAWRTYLRKYNKGRGVVLIGHSQGTFVLRQLVTKEIDPKPAARRKLISARAARRQRHRQEGQGRGRGLQARSRVPRAPADRLRGGVLHLRGPGPGQQPLRPHRQPGAGGALHQSRGPRRRIRSG